MDDIISPKELKKEADFRRLKSRNPVCLNCGYDRHSEALQYAHVSPRQFGVGDGGAVCMNCHCEMTAEEEHLGFRPTAQDRELEQAGRYVFALGEWLERISQTLKHFGAILLQRADHKGESASESEDQQ